jgi:hypothetical protein
MFNESEIRQTDRQSFSRYLKLEHYQRMNDYQKKQLLEAWRQDPKITTMDVFKALGWSQGDYYKELERLGIQTKERKPVQRRQKLAGDPKKQTSSWAISFSGDPQQLLEFMEHTKAHVKRDALGYRLKMELEEIAE